MKLVRLHIDHFGKLSDLSMEFADGLNVVSGVNESGKSTLHSFIGAMLLDLERGRGRGAKNDLFSHYRPWDGGRYGGSITIEHEGENYTIIRDFGPDNPSLTIIRDEDGKRMPATQSVVRELTGGLTAHIYKNTISVGQLSAGTDKNLADELRNHIVNLKSAGSYNLDVAGAIDKLQLLRKKYNGTYDKDADDRRQELASEIQETERYLRHNSCGTGMEELNRRRTKAEEKLGIYEDENEELSNRTEKILEKHGFLCRTGSQVILWILAVILAAGLGISLYLGLSSYSAASLNGSVVACICTGGCCLLGLAAAFVILIRSCGFRKQIKDNENRQKELMSLVADVNKELRAISEEKEREQKYQWEREQKEEELAEREHELESLKPALDANEAIRRETQAINLAITTMEQISKNEFASFGSFLEKLSSALISSITGGAYQGLSIGDNMQVSLIRNGGQVELSSVSTGTLDQVYLAVRLACIGFFWEEEDMPLLLDDTFAMYDDSRLERTLTWLSEIYEGQVIIFTCHLREAEILEVLDIPYRLIRL